MPARGIVEDQWFVVRMGGTGTWAGLSAGGWDVRVQGLMGFMLM